MCCLRVCKGNFPLRIRRKTPRPPCFRRPFGAGSCSGICRAICAKRDGVFWLRAGQRCPSTYRRRSREFFGCAWGKGVSLPTTEGDGVFWLRVGRGCPPSYRRGGGMEFFGCRQSEGVSLPTTEGQEQKNAHPAGGMGGGGLLRAYNWSAADTIRTHLDGETNSPYPKPYNTPY